jgi:outer membrane protein OmpA-like peptidoglycan-associated protein
MKKLALAVTMSFALLTSCATTSSSTSTTRDSTGEDVVQLEGDRITVGDALLFEVGKANIETRLSHVLNAVARILEATPAISKLTIEGYADSTGDETFNKQLSQDRAEAVKAYLLKKGVEPSRLEAVGLGTEHPVAPNDTDEGRAKNRRVEFKVTR